MSRNRLFNARTLVLGGLAVAVAAGALKNRRKVAGLIGARSSEPEPYTYTPSEPREERPPAVSNYDTSGPPANTATPVPAPEPVVRENHPDDEEAEEAAAAAEAANIGGPAPEYAASIVGEESDDADRPLEEAGEGVAEGEEQTEADLRDSVELTGDDDTTSAGSALGETPASEKSSAVWRSSAAEDADEQPTVEQAAVETTEPAADAEAGEDDDEGDNGSEWQTWSGRAVDR